ncbi:MAG TPA: protein kinase [Thermoanaerobaculia bacterium]|nr:protein kinase [Thermoanaerobaculia bacterium]
MTLSSGTRLGSYEILSPLGAGGMGEVYRARDAKLKRDVAVKVLPVTLAGDADALSRFEREALAVAALSHPNILAIHDFGSQDGTAYAVTELLEGDTLRGRLDAGTVAQRQALDWSLQIAKGLSAAHSKGVVHRDLKPENVFVTNDGHVKILDFGLAKRVDEVQPDEKTNAPTGTGHTQPGTVMGTMGYMSPEQLRGLPVDHRSDIFSFGTILYELLSGKKAFKRDTASDTIAAVLREEPAELTQTGRNVSPALDHIVRHCLEKDRESRFQSARDVAFALSEASSPTATVTSGAHVVRGRAGASTKTLAIAGIALVVLAGIGLLLWKRPASAPTSTAPGVKRVAVLPFENLGAPEDDYFADGISDEVRAKLTSVSGLQVIARGSSTPYKKTTKTPRQIAQELDAAYLLTATVRWEKGGSVNRVHVTPELVEVTGSGAPASKWQQPFDAAITDVFQVQSDIATKVTQALGVALAETDKKQLSEKPTENLAAYDAFLKGEAASQGMSVSDPPSQRKAVVFYEQAVKLDPRFAQAWARLSMASSTLYANTVPSTELADRALEAAEKSVALAPGRPEGYIALGRYHDYVKGDFLRAGEQFARALQLEPTNVDAMTASGATEEGLGRWDAALDHLRQGERLDPRSLSALRRLGTALLYTRHPVDARAVFDRALTLAPNSVGLIQFKALTFLEEGNLAGARAALAAAPKDVEPAALVAYMAQYNDLVWVFDAPQRDLLLKLKPSDFDDDKGAWAIAFTQAYALRGDAARTRSYAGEARDALEVQLRDQPGDAQRRVLLGVALAYLGQKEDAIREGLKAVSLLPISKDAYTGVYIQHQLVRIYTLAGEPEKALEQLEPLLNVPYILTPAWLKIDPNFDPLRGNPRFQRLVAAAK